MNFDYNPILAVVNDLLPQFGVACYAITTDNSYNPDNPTGGSTEVRTDGFAVMDEIKQPFGGFNNDVQIGDMALIATPELALQTGTVVYIDSQKWRVLDPKPIKPANLLLGYQAHVRRQP